MTGRTNKPITMALLAGACTLLCTASASGEFVTFWKTSVCPNFPGVGPANGGLPGVMQVALGGTQGSIGGVFCNLSSDQDTTSPGGTKVGQAITADVEKTGGDDGPGIDKDAWECIVCNYSKPGAAAAAAPALSQVGTAILLGAILTSGAVVLIRRRQALEG